MQFLLNNTASAKRPWGHDRPNLLICSALVLHNCSWVDQCQDPNKAPFLVHRGPPWAILGPCWGHFGIKMHKKRRYQFSYRFWKVWGSSWGHIVASWGHPGTILGPSSNHLRATLGPSRTSWGHLGAILEPSWSHLWATLGLSWAVMIMMLGC